MIMDDVFRILSVQESFTFDFCPQVKNSIALSMGIEKLNDVAVKMKFDRLRGKMADEDAP